MSYINRERLLKYLYKENSTSAKPSDWINGWNAAITHAKLMVQQRPAAPIKRRAKAPMVINEMVDASGKPWKRITKCGICGDYIMSPSYYKYCPYCGAKLEG